MEDTAIKLRNVTKIFKFGNHLELSNLFKNSNGKSKGLQVLTALDDISFTISKGETIGLMGLNGSGKTTLLRTIAGIYDVDSGSVEVNGRLAPLLQIGVGFNGELDPKENIMMYGLLLGLTKSEINAKIGSILEFGELEEFQNMKLKHFSTGMRARLGFATALEINPDIILIDEVLAVGDVPFREKSFRAFSSFKKNKKTIVFSTHNMNLISNLSDRVILMDHGKLVQIGKPSEVIPFYKKIIDAHKKI